MRVIATQNFTVGPQREVVVQKGAIREVALSPDGQFWTETDKGSLFGECALGRGWMPEVAATPTQGGKEP